MAWVLSRLENEVQDKRVENVWFPCADEGSTPSNSTIMPVIMKTTRLSFFAMMMLALVGLTSCEKAVLDEDTPKTSKDAQQGTQDEDSTTAKVTLRLRVNLSRAGEDALPWKILQFEIFNKSDKSVAHIIQNEGDDEYGTASVQLTPGTYKVSVLAHSLMGEPQFDSPTRVDIFSKNDFSDVFFSYSVITVESAAQEHEITLQRATALVRFHTKDVVPDEVKSFRFFYSGGSSTLNLGDGLGIGSANQTLTFNVTDSMRGKPLSVDLYTFKVSKNETINLTVNAYKTTLEATPIVQYMPAKEYVIPIKHGEISDCTTTFFSDADDTEIDTGGSKVEKDGATSFKIKVDTAWAGINYYNL